MTVVNIAYSNGKAEEEWFVIAKRDGSQTQMRAMTVTFGLSPSKDEALHRVRRTLAVDPDFRAKYRGWRFVAARTDDAVVVGVNDVIHVFRNDSRVIQVSA